MDENLQQELERLRAENERLKGAQKGGAGIYFKVSPKGAVSAYGLGRFPVTLYKEQWTKLLDKKQDVLDFIAENNSLLKTKK